MDTLYTNGISFAQSLQATLPELENFWLWVTFLGDPKCVFIIYFPVAYFTDQTVGIKVLCLGIVTEWLNLVLKWFLFGERPFWWVLESGYSNKEDVFLQQFPLSCETGPGSPSGHCMITGSALWPVVTTLTTWLSRHSKSWLVKAIPFEVYLLLLLAIGLSRIFVLAHFPHQVLGGIMAAIGLGWFLESRVPLKRELSFYLLTSLALLLSSITIYWMLFAVGIDPSWSISLATKWCANPKWVRIDTQPFASLCRDVALAFGLGLALHSSTPQLKGVHLSRSQWVVCTILALAVLQLVIKMAQPQNLTLWYGVSFVKYATVPLLVMALLPRMVQAMPFLTTPHHCKDW